MSIVETQWQATNEKKISKRHLSKKRKNGSTDKNHQDRESEGTTSHNGPSGGGNQVPVDPDKLK